MGLTRHITRQIEVPHEPGQFFVVRKLSWQQLEEAQEARVDATLRRLAETGKAFASLRDLRADAAVADPDPLNAFDRATLLRHGVVAWSYDAEVTPETLADLDEPTAAWAAREILALATAPRSEADRKNAS